MARGRFKRRAETYKFARANRPFPLPCGCVVQLKKMEEKKVKRLHAIMFRLEEAGKMDSREFREAQIRLSRIIDKALKRDDLNMQLCATKHYTTNNN